ncbi:alanine racemase [Iamia majanohamensis]|uniref:Alanine racemase n=1 Tax=Iamia majanohamensis TaxID=467976 RepID=A0AAE9Y8W0_9ACTN|nr:alanine racemase [Iamia majanohamensis]WCO68757.1 alanine racemase [Iamia majanohamensis]
MTTRVQDLPTPSLVVEADVLAGNVATMAAARPGPALRPHVKAFKSTALARELVAAGHEGFCCATPAEVVGMGAAGLGTDLLLANEVVDRRRLAAMVASTLGSRITVAVDSPETVAAAAAAGVREVLVDVEVGLPRCGCPPDEAADIADAARAAGLAVRGVMGYEGHLMMEADDKSAKVAASMDVLRRAHEAVGGDVVSGGGTGTWDTNHAVTELQAGSYTHMDGDYARLGTPFRPALTVLATVVSTNRAKGWAVADAGLKALATDHGPPTLAGHDVWFCSDEHTTFAPTEGTPAPAVGDRVRLLPGHVDPTVALHDRLHLVQGDEVVDTWPVDLRGWDAPVP